MNVSRVEARGITGGITRPVAVVAEEKTQGCCQQGQSRCKQTRGPLAHLAHCWQLHLLARAKGSTQREGSTAAN